MSNLFLDLWRIHHVQDLADGRFAGPFTGTGTDAVGSSEELEEVVRHLAVPELDGTVTGRSPLEFLGNAGRVGDRIEQHFGVEPFEQESRVVLLVSLVRLVRFGPTRSGAPG